MSITTGDSPLKSSTSRPGSRHGGSRGLGTGARLYPVLEKEGPFSGQFSREGLCKEHELRKLLTDRELKVFHFGKFKITKTAIDADMAIKNKLFPHKNTDSAL